MTNYKVEDVVKQKQLQVIFKSLLSTQVAAVFIAIITLVILLDHINKTLLISWFTVFIVVVLMRLVDYYFFHTDPSQLKHVDKWEKRFLRGVLLSGITWGLLACMINMLDSIIHQMFLVIVVMGACAGAFSSLSHIYKATVIFLYCVLPVTALQLFIVGSDMSISIGVFTLLFLIILNLNSKRFNVNIYENIKLTIEAKEREIKLITAQTKAEIASKSKDEFLANISHEIRTPLNAINGYTNLISKTVLTDEQKEYVESTEHSCNVLLNLINDILDFSKIEAGKMDIIKEEFRLDHLITKLTSIHTESISAKGLKFIVNKPDLDYILINDETRLQQILTNLISNAVKFTSKGFIELNIDILEENECEYVLEFSLSDSGIGISEDKMNTIFESFTQADNSITRHYGGTGLGLSISNRLSKLLGGTTLHVESKEGEGSKFTFSIPFQKGTIMSKDIDKSDETSIQEKSLKQHKILLVEDNAFNIKLTTTMLEKENQIVEVARNGEEALSMVFKNDYDIVFMDMQMPVMDGLTATKAIREKEQAMGGRHTPIIAMTANAMSSDIENCKEAGMDDFVGKPFKMSDVRNAIMKNSSKKI